MKKGKLTKILAAVGLGITGASVLAGCSLSDDQQKALDLITEKADTIIELTEKNMQLTNSQLSKADAAEMILLARTKLSLGLYDEMFVDTLGTAYTGFFDKVVGNAQGVAPKVYFRKTNDFKYVALGDYDGSIVTANKAVFATNKVYTYTHAGNVTSDYTSNCFDLSTQLDVFEMLGYGTVTIDDIVNVENKNDFYRFNLLRKNYMVSGGSNVIISTLLSTVEISKTGDILSCEFDVVNKTMPKTDVRLDGEDIVLGEDGLPIIEEHSNIEVSALNYVTEYKYTGIDFTPAEAITNKLGGTN